MTTIHDVAALAEVSPTTISRYLNNRIELPKETIRRIDQAILTLDYRPNLMAKRLSLGRTETIGLVTPEFGNPFFASLAAGIEDEAEKHGYSVLMSSTHGERHREIKALQRLKDRHVDGLIMMTNQPDDGSLKDMVNRHSNVVILDEDIPGVHAPRLFVENAEGARLATQHLIDMGHRRIAHIGGPQDLLTGRERLGGYLSALQQNGLAVDDALILFGDYSPDFGAIAMEKILDNPNRPTAIFAGSDALILGILRTLRSHSLTVPEDISLVGFDDSPFSEFMAPPLTTIRQPADELGRAGFRALLALLSGQSPTEEHRFPVTLIERQSVRKISV